MDCQFYYIAVIPVFLIEKRQMKHFILLALWSSNSSPSSHDALVNTNIYDVSCSEMLLLWMSFQEQDERTTVKLYDHIRSPGKQSTICLGAYHWAPSLTSFGHSEESLDTIGNQVCTYHSKILLPEFSS